MTQGGGRERRAAAVLALAAALASLALATVGLVLNLGRLALAVVLLVGISLLGWYILTSRGVRRVAAGVASILAAGVLVWTVVSAKHHGLLLGLAVVLVAVSFGAARFALRHDLATLSRHSPAGSPVGPARSGVLIMNPKSGGGKAERFALVEQARNRGIKAVVLQPEDDLLQLCEDAAGSGADVLGIAGGDGCQALAASVAMAHDLALVCVPAGTRNHFALDLGLDRADVVGALDAFGEAVERRIDLAQIGDRVFVNNVSLGIYATIVQSPDYREAKRQTAEQMLPDLLGPTAKPLDLEFTGPDGVPHPSAQLIQISNNPYILSRAGGFGTRPSLDTGHLGVAIAEVRGAAELAELVALEAAGQIRRFGGWLEWETPRFEVRSSGPVEAGVDGEALKLEPPLEFRSLPAALRVRIPANAPGLSPAARSIPSAWWMITTMLRTVAGRPAAGPPASGEGIGAPSRDHAR